MPLDCGNDLPADSRWKDAPGRLVVETCILGARSLGAKVIDRGRKGNSVERELVGRGSSCDCRSWKIVRNPETHIVTCLRRRGLRVKSENRRATLSVSTITNGAENCDRKKPEKHCLLVWLLL